MRPFSVLIAALALTACAVTSEAKTPAPAAVDAGAFTAARLALRGAVTRGTPADVLKARAGLAALSEGAPKSAPLHFWVALADWRAVPRLLGTDRVQAERYCKDGLGHLDQALRLEPNDAEAIALKASLQGISLAFNPGDMMTLGAEMEGEMSRATALAPKNPRVLFLEALSTLNKPEFVGGGPDKALEHFRKAQAAFDAEPADTTGAAWGRDDAYVWAGRAAMKLGDHAGAIGYYLKALEVSPDHAWTKNSLLPEAQKALVGSQGAPAAPGSAPAPAASAPAAPGSAPAPAASAPADSSQSR
jgi:tetratricopeptide (TPR) repeat protein